MILGTARGERENGNSRKNEMMEFVKNKRMRDDKKEEMMENNNNTIYL